jgi:hypothetical protein
MEGNGDYRKLRSFEVATLSTTITILGLLSIPRSLDWTKMARTGKTRLAEWSRISYTGYHCTTTG